MPKKTIKEMSELERRRHSLEAKTFHAVLMGSLILGVMSLAWVFTCIHWETSI